MAEVTDSCGRLQAQVYPVT